ncbi:hypothetical protein FRB99_005593 [Tulasnella sp. 403]|nr:hypothetical protein FRB99_005593 [Tulasnella sp. 403]
MDSPVTAHPSETKEQTSWEGESSNDYPIPLTQAVILMPIDFTKQPVVDYDQLEEKLSQPTKPKVDPAHDLVEEHSRSTSPMFAIKPTEPLVSSKETKDPFIVRTPSTPMTHKEILKALGASIESIYSRPFPEEGEAMPPPEEPSYSPLFPTLNDLPEPEGLSYYASLSPRRAPLPNPEKLRRRNLGLCLYCGLSGHQVQECLQLMHHPAKVFTARELYPDRITQAPPSRIVKGKQAKLTEEEKICRLNLGLCMYCGTKGHIAKNCLEPSKQQRKIAELATPTLNH